MADTVYVLIDREPDDGEHAIFLGVYPTEQAALDAKAECNRVASAEHDGYQTRAASLGCRVWPYTSLYEVHPVVMGGKPEAL